MRMHFVGLPHVVATKEYNACAYNCKHIKTCRMMRSLGHHVIDYSAEGSQVDCDEHVTIITAQEQERFFGGHDWKAKGFNIKWDIREPYWRLANQRAAEEIKKRLEPGDFICLIGGNCQKPIADTLGEQQAIVVEYGCGYNGCFSNFIVFESFTHQACVYGMLSKDPDGHLYHTVIPNSYDPDDFPKGDGSGDYLLFISRLIHRKGIEIALETAKASGLKLILAGQGVHSLTSDLLVTEEGMRIPLEPGRVEYAGYADVAKRAFLMGNARAIMQPTLFMEPFGGTVVEAAVCGTPAITTNYAAFSETVVHGVTGYRCSTLAQFVEAAHRVKNLDRNIIRKRALQKYSIWNIRHEYNRYFETLYGLWGAGWPETDATKGAVSDLGIEDSLVYSA